MELKRNFIKQVDLRCAIYGKRLEANAVQSERDKQKTKQKKENLPATRSKE